MIRNYVFNDDDASVVSFLGKKLRIPQLRHATSSLTATATLDFPSINAQLSSDLTVTVTGAALGDVVSLGVPFASVNANTCFTAFVSAANVVTVRFNNYSSGASNPASGSFNIIVFKYF